jgi:hypothetical protein
MKIIKELVDECGIVATCIVIASSVGLVICVGELANGAYQMWREGSKDVVSVSAACNSAQHAPPVAVQQTRQPG